MKKIFISYQSNNDCFAQQILPECEFEHIY